MVEENPPDGGVYEWYRRGLALLADGHPAAAATLLARAAEAEPDSRSLLEALGRAQYDAGRYEEAMATFTGLIARNPTDDYAHFGLGLCLMRRGDRIGARRHLKLAVAMRPDQADYRAALARVADDA